MLEHAFQLIGILTGLALVFGAMLYDLHCQRPHAPDDEDGPDPDTQNLPLGMKF